MVSILEQKGLVQKESVGGNMYRALLKLTDAGKAAARHVQERVALAVKLVDKGLEAVRYITIGSIIGTHAGLGAVAVAFFKK